MTSRLRFRAVLNRQKNMQVIQAEAIDIDPDQQKVVLRYGKLTYDTLIVATGSSHHYFGHDEWAEMAPGLKTIEDALDIRRRILLAFEAAEREPNPEKRRAWMRFVIAGGGPTGVELAGALAELARSTLKEAIFTEWELPAEYEDDIERNADFFLDGPAYWDFDLEEQREQSYKREAYGSRAMPIASTWMRTASSRLQPGELTRAWVVFEDEIRDEAV